MFRNSSINLVKIIRYTFTFFAFSLILLFGPSIYAADVTLAWQANSEPNVDGYYIYYKAASSGAPYNGSGADEGDSPIKVPLTNLNDPENPQYTVHGLSNSTTSFIVITAYDTGNNESGYSNEVVYQPASAPTLSSLSISGADQVNESSNSNYTATATFADGSTQVVTSSAGWSEDSEYSQINSSGNLTTSEVSGDTTITIQAGYTVGGVTKTASKTVTIIDIPNSVTLSSLAIIGNDFVDENNSSSYTATATFSDGGTQTVTNSAEWSEDSTYAHITSGGLMVTSEVPGDTTIIIRASYTIGGITRTATKTVTITDIPVSAILSSLVINGEDFVNENSSSSYTATATFSDGSTQTVTSSANWNENSAFAGINASGLLTTSEVPNDVTAYIQASYFFGGVSRTAAKMVTIVDVPASNLPPNTPIITYPDNGQTGIDEPLEITADSFNDPNVDDAHSKTQWQISEQNDFSNIVLDVTSDNYLTMLPVPSLVLKPNQKYYVRIRFYDAYFEASEWSSTVEFTTNSLIDDLNSNGIPDNNDVDDTVDSNLDNIPDINQPEIIKSVKTVDGSAYIGIEKVKASKSIIEIEALKIIDPKIISDTVNRPIDLIFGLVSYRLRVKQPGDSASLKIHFSGEVYNSDTFYKYDTINGWVDYSEHATFNNDKHSVTIEVEDGGYGDSDGLANGIIVDPFGLASGVISDSYSYSESNELFGIKGCFIATAAFGSKFEKHVQLLRRFRDLYLMPYKTGRAFVKAYYTYSPPIADFIAHHDMLRRVVRWSLIPLIGFSWMLLHIGILPTLFFLFSISFSMLFYLRKIRLKRQQVVRS